MVSFVILVTVLIINHSRSKPTGARGGDEKAGASASSPPKKPDTSVAKNKPNPKGKPNERSNPSVSQRQQAATRQGGTSSRLPMQIGGTGEAPKPSVELAAPKPSTVAAGAGNRPDAEEESLVASLEEPAPPKPVTPDENGPQQLAANGGDAAPKPADAPGASLGRGTPSQESVEVANRLESPPPAPVSTDQPESAAPSTEASSALASPASSDSTSRRTAAAVPATNAAAPKPASPEPELPGSLASSTEKLGTGGSNAAQASRPDLAASGAGQEQLTNVTPEQSRPAGEVPNLTATPAATVGSSNPAMSADAAGLVALPNSKKPLAASKPLEVSEPPTVIAPGPAAPPDNTDSPVEPFVHVVQRGENFFTISRLYYGSGRFYKALWKANQNQVKAPDELYIGTAIRVPPPELLDRSLIESPKRAAAAPSPTTAVRRRKKAGGSTDTGAPGSIVVLPVRTPSTASRSDEPSETRPARRFHVVKKYETLRTIARDELGDSHRDEELRDLNLRLLGDSVELTAGMRLELPDEERTVRK